MTPTFRSVQFLLESHNIQFSHIHHEATPTSADSARIRGDELKQGAKAIVYKVQNDYCLFVMAADKRMNTKLVKEYFKKIGRKAKKSRFVSADELFDLTGLIPGSVPPFGKPILDLDLFVDPSLGENKNISFNAGSITDSIKMKYTDYERICGGNIFKFCD